MHVAVERETKLEAGLEFVLPDLGPVVGRTRVLEPLELWSSYFDTRDLRLWEHGVTLRHRRGEADGPGVWTLKVPHGTAEVGVERAEHTWSAPLDGMPSEVRGLVQGLARSEPLRVVAELECLRRRVRLVDPGGTPVGEVDDDTVTVHGGRQDGHRFREVELEVPAWDPRTREVLDRLVAAGARPGPSAPKLERVLGPPSEVSRYRVVRDREATTIADVVRAAVDGSLSRLLENDLLLRSHPGDPPVEAVHRGRVAARRLRSDIRTLSPLLDPVWTVHVSDDLRWLGAALGRVRDIDVLTGRLVHERATGAIDPEGLAVLLSALRTERTEAARALGAVLEDRRYLTLLDKLHAAAGGPPIARPGMADRDAGDVLPLLVRQAWKRLHRRVRRARKDASDHRLHQVRIGAKQLRYGAELAAPVIGPAAARTARRAKRLQTVLGDHQDAVAARAWLERWSEAGPPIAAFAAGQVAAGEARRRMEARSRWEERWHRLGDGRARSWLA